MHRREVDGALAVTARWQAGLICRRQALDAGFGPRQIGTRVADGTWHRVSRGVYDVFPGAQVLADRFDQVRLRSAWIGILSTFPRGIATGACALALQGFDGLPMHLRPEVTLPDAAHCRGAAGVVIRRFEKPMRLRRLGEHLLVDPVVALIQALPEWDRDTAVSVLDAGLNQARITPRDLEEVRCGVRGRRGAAKLGLWWTLVDPRAESPVETIARLKCLDAGLPRPELQVQIRDGDGAIIARGDFGWRRGDGTWVLVEIDGKSIHGRPEALYRDRSRQNAIALTGRHTQLRFTKREVVDGGLVRVIAAALAR